MSFWHRGIFYSVFNLIFIFSIIFKPLPVSAASDSQIKYSNIGCQAVLSLFTRVIEGKVKTKKDVLEALIGGGISGYGFYEAKRSAGNGHLFFGVLLANLSASIAENVAHGDGPLDYVGYTIGPFRIHAATPFLFAPPARFDIELSGTQTVTFISTMLAYKNPVFRYGMIVFEEDGKFGDYPGITEGCFPAIRKGAYPYVWRHEFIHAFQSLQIDAVEPILLDLRGDAKKSLLKIRLGNADKDLMNTRLIRFRGIRNGALSTLNTAWQKRVNYLDRWVEIEAYHLTKINWLSPQTAISDVQNENPLVFHTY